MNVMVSSPANKEVQVTQLWTKAFKKKVYNCAICHLIGNSAPDIVGCSFSAEMRVFNLKGNETLSTEFSPDITCFKAAPIREKTSIELVTCDIDGFVRVADKSGDPIWSTKLEAPVACMDIGDFRGEGKSEIIVGLENKKLVGLDNAGKTFLSFETKETILDCAIGRLPVKTTDVEKKIVVLLKNGTIMSVIPPGHLEQLFQFENDPRCLTLVDDPIRPMLIIGDRQGFLKVLDADGKILDVLTFSTGINCLDGYNPPPDQPEDAYFVAATENNLNLFKIVKTGFVAGKSQGKEMICPHCGATARSDEKACRECGSKLQ